VARALAATVGKVDERILFRRYVIGEPWDALVHDDVTPDSIRMRALRAVQAITDHLNGIPAVPGWGGPGSRRAKSNKVMQHINDNAYGGES
jgi:hypothetical protein